jgi:hypothetical protein
MMAEVAVHGHARSSSSLTSTAPGHGLPRIEMMPNPDFSFPMRPQPSVSAPSDNSSARRPTSMHSTVSPAVNIPLAHRRAVSTLPSFSFNAANASGLADTSTPPSTPDETSSVTPSRRGHRRGGSEFVGGDSRLGVNGAISSSPTKDTGLPLLIPSGPSGRRGHAHRRSAAMSSHDVTDIMRPTEPEPRLSSSLPSTPLEQPPQPTAPRFELTASAFDATKERDPFAVTPADAAETRPPSRPRVGFSDNIEYIPRPLSTISSETESSISTVRGHSVNNSISSVLSLSSPSPPSARSRQTSLSTTFEDEPRSKARSSLEVSKRVEKEGEWLRSSASSSSIPRPLSESSAAPKNLSFATHEAQGKESNVHGKKHSLSHALGFDRRRSEPAISIQADHLAHLSAISLQEDLNRDAPPRPVERKKSTKRIKDWAMARLSKKARDAKRTSAPDPRRAAPQRPQSSGVENDMVPGKVPISDPPVAETNLDAVLGGPEPTSDESRLGTPAQPRIEVSTPTPSYAGSFGSREMDDSPVLDLDAALGPFKTPGSNFHKPRRELHSSRLNKDFSGPGLHYHRRAESAPELPPFGFSSRGMASQSSLPDVFEGEGEEEAEAHDARPTTARSLKEEEAGTGIQVVDSDAEAGPSLNFNDGLRIQEREWEPERPSTSYGTSTRLSTPSIERRPSSIIEETIPEELSPIEPIEIVEAHEEPRASSLTKSSDSSETPTILASPNALSLPGNGQTLMTPETYQTSNFSSPDFSRRQGSFDTSRLGTSASSVTDGRTMSSSTGEPLRVSTDDVPSLTSSLSTRLSTMHANTSRRDFSSGDHISPDVSSGALDPAIAAERRRKRASIASLSQLVGGSFSGKPRPFDESRPQTAVDSLVGKSPKKEHRLKKLMFWRSKSKQSLRPTEQ